MSRILLMSAVCVAVFAVGCSAQQPPTSTSPPTDNKATPLPATADEPKAPKALVITSQALTRQVLAEAEKAVEADPKSAEGYRQRGEAHYFLGQLKEAERDLLRAVELDESDDDARYALCRTLRAIGKAAQADTVAEALKKRNPNFQMPLELLGNQELLKEATTFDELAWHTWHRRIPDDLSETMAKNPTLAVKRAFAAAVRPDAGDTKRKRFAQQIASLGDVAQDGYRRLNNLVVALENKYLSIIDNSVDKAVAQNPFVDRETLTRELFPIVADRVKYCQELKVWIAEAVKTVDEKPTSEKSPQPKSKAKPADLPAPDEAVRKRTDKILEDTNAQLKESPKDFGEWQLRAEMRYHRGEFDEALADLDRAIRLAPERIARTMIPHRIRILAAANRTTELKEVEDRFLNESPIAGAYLVHVTDGKKLRTVIPVDEAVWLLLYDKPSEAISKAFAANADAAADRLCVPLLLPNLDAGWQRLLVAELIRLDSTAVPALDRHADSLKDFVKGVKQIKLKLYEQVLWEVPGAVQKYQQAVQLFAGYEALHERMMKVRQEVFAASVEGKKAAAAEARRREEERQKEEAARRERERMKKEADVKIERFRETIEKIGKSDETLRILADINILKLDREGKPDRTWPLTLAEHRLAYLFDKEYLGSFSSDNCEENFRKELYRRLTGKPFKIPPELSNEKFRKLTEAEREKAFARELAERNRQARESLKAICTDDELAPLGDNLLFETFRAVAWSRPKIFHSSDELAKLLDSKLERDVSVYVGEQQRYPNNWIDHRTFPKVWEVKATATTK